MLKKQTIHSKKINSYWSLPLEDLLEYFQINPNKGLSEVKARQRYKKYGVNTLKVQKKTGVLRLLWAQFNTPLIYLLLFAAILSFLLYDKVDALILMGILSLSTFLSFIQEKGAVRAVEELLSLVQIKTIVMRDERVKKIPIEKVVPGDLLILKAGSTVPGDCYLLESKDLYVDEAALTGETFYIEKAPGIFPEQTPLSKRLNVLFMGTHVISGTAKALVVHTGKQTEFGKISEQLQKEVPKTEFEMGVRYFGYFLMELTFFLLLIIFACNVYLQRPFLESILFALALSVGLTPQLLPAIITINLSHGARQMAKQGVIVKKLVSIENLGGMDVLCSDKTGTLTEGDIVFDRGCDSKGEPSEKVCLYAYLNAFFQTGYENPIDRSILKKQRAESLKWQKVDEVPYDFIRKRLSVLLCKEQNFFIITKGAFKEVMSVCTCVEGENGKIEPISRVSEQLISYFTKLSEEGYRVLAVAYKPSQRGAVLKSVDEVDMTFLGFLLFLDPIKDSAINSIKELKKLGVSFKIITGDNHLVALQVGKLFGFSSNDLLVGSDLQLVSDRALPQLLAQKSVFSEIEPNQKERIILALRKEGHVVGFLGDGINDVTALHAADVSLSVDSAVDAAKEVAHIVLLKKDLAVLKEGIVAGRMTFANTLKYVFMASSANFGNMFSMAGASLFLPFLPLLPKQVLLTNLLTDFPEMTIATDRVDAEMIEKPLRWNIQFIRKFMLIFGLISSLFDYATFGLLIFFLKASEEEFRTGWFIESVVSATLIVLVIRTFKPFFTSKPSRYLLITAVLVVGFVVVLPFLPIGSFLGFTPLSPVFYGALAGIIVLYVISVELAKKKFLKNGLSQK